MMESRSMTAYFRFKVFQWKTCIMWDRSLLKGNCKLGLPVNFLRTDFKRKYFEYLKLEFSFFLSYIILWRRKMHYPGRGVTYIWLSVILGEYLGYIYIYMYRWVWAWPKGMLTIDQGVSLWFSSLMYIYSERSTEGLCCNSGSDSHGRI